MTGHKKFSDILHKLETEVQWQTKVVDLAHIYGWKVAHFRKSRRRSEAETGDKWETAIQYDAKGFPDLVLVHPIGGVLYRELKTAKGVLSPEQKLWGEWLTAAGQDWQVWRPSQWEEVMAVLASKSAK